MDSTLELYRNVVRFDSTSPEGLQALFAIEYIYEYRLLDYDSAKQVTQAIIDLFPDSSFVSRLNDKFKEPSSGSIFNMSDEDIAAVRAQSHDVLTAQPDSTGWPPAEETLEGRRYR